MVILLLIVNIFTLNSAVLHLDTNTRYQTFQGWETGLSIVSHTGTLMGTDTTYKYITDDLMNIMVDSIGVTRCRIEFRSGVENTNDNWQDMIDGKITYDEWKGLRYLTINDNDNPNDLDMSGFHFSELDNKIKVGLLPLKKKLEENGQKLYINLCYVAFKQNLNAEEYIHNNPEEYAEVILAAFTHIKEKYGFTPDGLEVFLEPDVAKFGDGKLVGQCMVAAGDLLKENGFTPEFIASSCTNVNNALSDNYLKKFVEVPRILEYWTEFSYHLYTGRTGENYLKVAEIGKQYNVRTSMLEWWSLGHNYNEIHKSLKLANNSAYQYMSSISAPIEGSDHYAYIGTEFISPDNYNIDLKIRTKYASQYIKNIRPGDERVGVTSDDGNVDPIAFVNNSGNVNIISIVKNKSQLEFKNLAPGEYKVLLTTGNGTTTLNNFEKIIFYESITEGKSILVDVPASSIVVLKQESNSETNSVEQIKSSMSIYPNPTSNEVAIEFYAEIRANCKLNLYDLNGRLIQNIYKGYSKIGKNYFNINLKNQINSTYILKLEIDGKVVSKKIIKE